MKAVARKESSATHPNTISLTDQMLLSAFMGTVPDHLYFKDRESRFVSVSLSLAQSLGCSVEEVLGKTDFDFFEETEARAFREAEVKVMTSGEPIIDRVIKHTWADGRETWSLNVALPMRNATGDIVGVFGTNKDITATVLTEQALERANRDLQEMSRKAGMAEIANNVLHNVGNVLNSVNVSASVIGGRVRDSKTKGLAKVVQLINERTQDLNDFLTRDERGKALPGYLNKLVAMLAAEQQGIMDELQSMTKNIEQIKEIVSAQQSYAGAASLMEPVQIKELMEDALRMNPTIERREITVVRDFAAIPVLLLDKYLVLQILVNLIGNAQRAMQEAPDRDHQLTLRVAIANVEGNPRLRVRVEDVGVGIAPENLTRLFAQGFTTGKNGHGFGLHRCALAAEEMDGTLTADSDGQGKGAVFTLELPARPATEML